MLRGDQNLSRLTLYFHVLSSIREICCRGTGWSSTTSKYSQYDASFFRVLQIQAEVIQSKGASSQTLLFSLSKLRPIDRSHPRHVHAGQMFHRTEVITVFYFLNLTRVLQGLMIDMSIDSVTDIVRFRIGTVLRKCDFRIKPLSE